MYAGALAITTNIAQHRAETRRIPWTDGNFDGSSQPEELRAANGVLTGITLGYTTCDKKDQFGNVALDARTGVRRRREGMVDLRRVPSDSVKIALGSLIRP